MAQEKERQKKASLPDSTTIGMGADRTSTSEAKERSTVCAQRQRALEKTEQRRERLKRNREWRLGMACRDEQRTSVSLRGEHTKRSAA